MSKKRTLLQNIDVQLYTQQLYWTITDDQCGEARVKLCAAHDNKSQLAQKYVQFVSQNCAWISAVQK